MKRNIVLTLAVLSLFIALSFAASAPTTNAEYLLTDYGDVSNTAAVNAALEKAYADIKSKGGGVLIIPPSVPRTILIQNLSQTERKSGWDGIPLVTVVDRRSGQDILVPPIGQWSPQGWNGMNIKRTMNFQGPGASSWGCFNALGIANQVIHGSSSHHNPCAEDVAKGKNAHIYVYNVRGLFVGQYLNFYSADGGFEPITVKSIVWDAMKKQYYVTADLEKDHKKGGYLSNKNVVGALQIESTHNADDQTMEMQITRKQYANGDSFVYSGTYIYQGDVLTQGGDEGGIVYNAEPSQDPNAFHSTVESVDWSKDALVFSPGVCDVEKVASSRPLINMNPKKWITTGSVKIVPPDNWSGIYVVHPDHNPDRVVKEGLDLTGWKFVRKQSSNDKFYPMLGDGQPVYKELYDGKADVPTVITWDGVPITKFKYTYQGRTYPSIITHYVNRLGGRIIASSDCGWTEAVIGRYFAVADNSECLCPNDKDYVACYPTGNPQRKVYRWYPITGFMKNADGTCSITLGRVRWFPSGAGAPHLYKEESYTWDGHEHPLTYIIAPGAMVYDVGDAWQDAYGGWADANKPRTLRLVDSPDRGTAFDFAKGDSIEQAIGADTSHPVAFRTRLWHNVPDNLEDGHGTIEINNSGTVAAGGAISIGGATYLEEVAQRKDRKPPFITAVDVRSATQTGLRFGADVTDAAIRFLQPRNRIQPIKWNHSDGETILTVDPMTGTMKVEGGSLSARMKGLSATTVAAHNLRGINVAVPKGSKKVVVAFPIPEADAKYSVSVEPNWLTNHAVIEKTAKGFKVVFAESAGAKAQLDWQLIR